MKKLLKIPALLFAIMLIVSSCGKDTKSEAKSADNTEMEQKFTVESDAERVCELVIDVKIAIGGTLNAIDEGADSKTVDFFELQAKAFDMDIKEIQKRNEGNEEFMKLQQSCMEAMNTTTIPWTLPEN